MSSKSLDKFYTNPLIAKNLLKDLIDNLKLIIDPTILETSLWIEPSVGNGAFYYATSDLQIKPAQFDLIDIDEKRTRISPNNSNVNELDSSFLDYWPRLHKNITNTVCIGNPPFGKNSGLAVKFVNHAVKFCDIIAFILPDTFRKCSILNRVDKRLLLHHITILPENSFVFEGNAIHVPTSWFVFIKNTSIFNETKIMTRPLLQNGRLTSEYFEWQKTPNERTSIMIQRVGQSAGRIFWDHATILKKVNSQSFYFLIINFEKLPETFNLDKFKSFNLENIPEKKWCAGMPTISKGEVVKYLENALLQ